MSSAKRRLDIQNHFQYILYTIQLLHYNYLQQITTRASLDAHPVYTIQLLHYNYLQQITTRASLDAFYTTAPSSNSLTIFLYYYYFWVIIIIIKFNNRSCNC